MGNEDRETDKDREFVDKMVGGGDRNKIPPKDKAKSKGVESVDGGDKNKIPPG